MGDWINCGRASTGAEVAVMIEGEEAVRVSLTPADDSYTEDSEVVRLIEAKTGKMVEVAGDWSEAYGEPDLTAPLRDLSNA